MKAYVYVSITTLCSTGNNITFSLFSAFFFERGTTYLFWIIMFWIEESGMLFKN